MCEITFISQTGRLCSSFPESPSWPGLVRSDQLNIDNDCLFKNYKIFVLYYIFHEFILSEALFFIVLQATWIRLDTPFTASSTRNRSKLPSIALKEIY